MTTREVLTAARRLLVEKGWCPGGEGHDGFGLNCELCVYLAVAKCSGTTNERIDAVMTLRRAIGLGEDDSLIDWNDAPGRTREEVLRAFDAAIDLASEEERDAE